MKNFYLNIILPTILSILLFILTIFLILIPRFRQNVMDGKREMIRELTNSALSILSEYEADERDGLLTREEAQKTAISRIQYLRYGEENKDYFWITDMTPIMIVHPFRSDLNGKDLTEFTDPHGKKLFVEFVETVKKNGQGYVDYMWQWKDDSLHIVPKLSYVKIFKPWNWVIGTGIYIEDVKKEIASLTSSMVRISMGISIVIASLLLYIFIQSYKIERKRIQAEEDLQKSNEKYRTLVEAATEGLIMLINGKISFANNVISKMTGYENTELLDLSIHEIISKNNNADILDIFSRDTVKEGKFELNLIKKNGGLHEVLVTSSKADFYGTSVNIIIVKDLSADSIHGITNLEYQKLISTLDVGFFKVDISSNGRFLYANPTTLRILGMDTFEELSRMNILTMIADAEERKKLRKELIRNGFLKNKPLKIIHKPAGFIYVSVSLVLLNNETPDDLICDGIIEDISVQRMEKLQTDHLITSLKAKDLVMEQSVSGYLYPAVRMDSDAELNEAVQILSKGKTDLLLLTKNGHDIIGVLTETDIQKRILALHLKLDNPSYLVMSSPVIYIPENTSVMEAIRICETHQMNHLVVRNESNQVSGIVRTKDIYKKIIHSFSYFQEDIQRAESDVELKQCYHNLQFLLFPLIKNEIPVKQITGIITSFSDSVIRRVIHLAINELGPPPVNFSFICMGSEGRKEETLLTDQDNAIIYEDVPEENSMEVKTYFSKLGERICSSLNHIGYSFCMGNIMAKNPKWCGPLKIWVRYFTDWITIPEPHNLLGASIFFDFRCVYGDESFTEILRNTITAAVKENPLFLYHLAYNTYITKPQHVSSGGLRSDKNAEMIDLKSAVIPLIMFARTYALQHDIWSTNTIDRLYALKEKNLISGNTADEIIFGYNFLMKIRFRNQVHLAENNEPLSNNQNYRRLMDPELHLLKKVLSSIPDYQNKIKSDFRIST